MFISLETHCPLGNGGYRYPRMGKRAAGNHDAWSVGHLLLMEQMTVQMKQAMNHCEMH